MPPSVARSPARLLREGLDVLASFGLSVTLLVTLFVLTLVGTIEQATTSLYEVQRRYFESWGFIYDVGPLSIPLPGATLVLGLLALNLTVGGVIRLRRGTATAGILVTHLGVLLLLGGSAVEWMLSDKGQVTLYEGSGASEFRSYYEWEVAVREPRPDGGAREWVLPRGRIDGLERKDEVAFSHADLPFDVRISGWTRNAEPRRAASGDASAPEGWTLVERPLAKEAEQNVAGARVALAAKGTRGDDPATPRGLLWGGATQPWTATVAGRTFEVEVRRRTWPLPFRLELTRFVKRDHPGTDMAAEFSSYVVEVEDGVSREVHITMNEPLRHRGYTLYQAGWGPQGAPPGTPLFSTFAVVRNPSDRVPLIACVVIAVGLLLHFVRKLVRHLASAANERAAPSDGPSS